MIDTAKPARTVTSRRRTTDDVTARRAEGTSVYVHKADAERIAEELGRAAKPDSDRLVSPAMGA